MCILCVVQKWSRRVATMLPWLVLPLIGFWLLSHLFLPPGFRFEITSPRLACVIVLLVTIFWYEILMPQLSAWRARRSAFNRERIRLEAIERQKVRKTATRLCRNCLSAYKDQNPNGGRFTCSVCGHVSKRPALDLSGLDENDGNLVKARRFKCKGGNVDGCSGFFVRLTTFLLGIRWGWIKSFVSGLLRESDLSHGEGLKKGEDRGFGESRGEKARRKAEEKRQARLEKEHLEEEERKQREDVARLVEEQRKLKDVSKEVDKERGKSEKRKDSSKSQERRKEKDRGSSKSNSDVEDFDRRVGKENERKKNENERRDFAKNVTGSCKISSFEVGNGTKVVSANTRVTGGKYLERVKGSIISSSKAFNGSRFFGKSVQSSANVVPKVTKTNGFVVDSASWRDPSSVEHTPRKLPSNGGDKINEASSHRPVTSDMKLQPTPKKSWQQLFTRTPSPLSSNENAINRSDQDTQALDRSPKLAGQMSPTHLLDNQTYFSLSSPFTNSTLPNSSAISSSVFSSPIEPIFSSGKLSHEEPEIFEDPCYVPDPISLLGPVSESLDNFPLDPMAGFLSDYGPSLHSLKGVSASAEVNRPSPIESPMSRLRVVEDRQTNFSQYPTTLNTQDTRTFMNDSSITHQQGTWQMWGTPPIGQDGLGLIGGPVSWLLPLGKNTSTLESLTYTSPHKAMMSESATNNQVLPVPCAPQTAQFSDCQDGGPFSPLGPCSGNKMTYGSPTVSAIGHPFELHPAHCWFKNDLAVHGSGEGTGNSNHGVPHSSLFPVPAVQSFWSSN